METIAPVPRQDLGEVKVKGIIPELEMLEVKYFK